MHTQEIFQTLLFITAEDQVVVLTWRSLLFRVWMQKEFRNAVRGEKNPNK